MGDIIHCRKKNEKLDIENDIALYYMLNEEDSTNEEELGGELPDPKNEMDDEDTIATKDFNTSTVHLNLKIIREENKKTNKSKKVSIDLIAEEEV